MFSYISRVIYALWVQKLDFLTNFAHSLYMCVLFMFDSFYKSFPIRSSE